MISLVKHILLIPFLLLDRIRVRGESVLWRCAYGVMDEESKLRLGMNSVFDLIAQKDPEKRFKFTSYLKALMLNTEMADKFASNLIENISLFESQLGQDCIVDTLFSGKADGVFVEIGVGDGKHISNTYFLERNRNWTGVLCEPSRKFHDSIRKKRNAILVTDAVYDRTGLEIGFSEVIGNEELSTLSDQKIADSHDRSLVREYSVTTVSFDDLYTEYLDSRRIDYLSVDTEGSELTILGAIDFERIEISVISVEHSYNKNKLDEITLLLNRFGYIEILRGVFQFDAIFLNKNLGNHPIFDDK